VTEKRAGNFRGIREDGRSASFALERIGRVYATVYRQRDEFSDEAFADVRERGRELLIPEPRLRDAQAEENGAVNLLDDQIEAIMPATLAAEEKLRCTQVLWELLPEAEELERATRRIARLREEVWQPFHQRARVLAVFGYLDFDAEKITSRGRWLADLHVDRPLLVGEALERGLFNSLEFHQLGGVVAALTADEDRNYGQLELDDGLVNALALFEDVGFKVSSEEWKLGIEPAPELNFSAGAAAVRWATGTEWAKLVGETGAEEGDLFRMLSRTGEALVQIAGLHRTHANAARVAELAAEAILREPVR
jgi:superfamily II RNA helicase